MLARLSIVLFLLLFSACSQEPRSRQSSPQAEQPSPTGDPRDKLVNDYLSELKKGEDGEEFWCDATNPKTLLSVSQTEILNVKDDDLMLKHGRWYVTRISSSTQGGQSVVKTWNIGVKGDGGPCIYSLVDRDKYQN